MTDFLDSFEFDPDGDDVINRETIPHTISSDPRSAARRMALQALYEIDSSSHSITQVMSSPFVYDEDSDASKGVDAYLNELLPDSSSKAADAQRIKLFILQLITGVQSRRADLDDILQSYADEWPIQQVATIDRCILRIALYELTILTTPESVVLDESVELAHLFGADGSTRFINGVLAALLENIDDICIEMAERTGQETPNN